MKIDGIRIFDSDTIKFGENIEKVKEILKRSRISTADIDCSVKDCTALAIDQDCSIVLFFDENGALAGWVDQDVDGSDQLEMPIQVVCDGDCDDLTLGGFCNEFTQHAVDLDLYYEEHSYEHNSIPCIEGYFNYGSLMIDNKKYIVQVTETHDYSEVASILLDKYVDEVPIVYSTQFRPTSVDGIKKTINYTALMREQEKKKNSK
jgi:hypothetical protein